MALQAQHAHIVLRYEQPYYPKHWVHPCRESVVQVTRSGRRIYRSEIVRPLGLSRFSIKLTWRPVVFSRGIQGSLKPNIFRIPWTFVSVLLSFLKRRTRFILTICAALPTWMWAGYADCDRRLPSLRSLLFAFSPSDVV
jgi:hypothetical protein